MERARTRKPTGPILAVGLVALLLSGCASQVREVPIRIPVAEGAQVIEHRVVAGETLGLIADNYYGDPDRAADIARANGLSEPNHVLPGSLLRLEFAAEQWGSALRRATAMESYNRGVDLFDRDRLGEAESQFRTALETAPELVGARYNLALVLLRRGRTTDALELLDELTRQRPRDADFRFARGNALFQLARFDEAADQFGIVLDLAPGHRRASFSLARSLQEGGHPDRARTAWERYLRLDDSSSWAAAARRHLRKLNDAGGE